MRFHTWERHADDLQFSMRRFEKSRIVAHLRAMPWLCGGNSCLEQRGAPFSHATNLVALTVRKVKSMYLLPPLFKERFHVYHWSDGVPCNRLSCPDILSRQHRFATAVPISMNRPHVGNQHHFLPRLFPTCRFHKSLRIQRVNGPTRSWCDFDRNDSRLDGRSSPYRVRYIPFVSKRCMETSPHFATFGWAGDANRIPYTYFAWTRSPSILNTAGAVPCLTVSKFRRN